jgi:hypothetical protein
MLCAAPLVAASAQSNWLEKGKSLLGTVTGSQTSPGGLTTSEIGAGLKEALRVGTETVVANLGRTDGFNADKLIHIPLPDSLKTVQKTLKRVGMSSMLDDLELRLNRAAETATPKAKALFWQAIEEMTLDDVKGIYEGPKDAATKYFQAKMSAPLAEEMRPIVDQSLAEVGAIKAYEGVMGEYKKMPFVPDAKADLTKHVLDLGIKGIFHYVAEEEAAIRADPVKRTTALLQKVFGAQ